jgi:hypothetical protein
MQQTNSSARGIVVEGKFRHKSTRSYILCGWRTRSDIPLTGVPESGNRDERVDVVIQTARGESPIAKDMGQFVGHSLNYSLIRIENVADFEIEGGRKIRVWPRSGVKQKDIEIYLFGPAWATLCHQRGLLPLHASAIVVDDRIIAFVGHSGAGKSTTAALMNSVGYELYADDILPISFNENSIPGAWPYLRRLKLHRDPLTRLALSPEEVVSERLDKEKYFVRPVSTGGNRWRRLSRLYLLDNEVAEATGDTLVEPITGADAVRTIVDQTYHFSFILGTQRLGDHLATCARLASSILIYRLGWPLADGAGEKLVSAIRTHSNSEFNLSTEKLTP